VRTPEETEVKTEDVLLIVNNMALSSGKEASAGFQSEERERNFLLKSPRFLI